MLTEIIHDGKMNGIASRHHVRDGIEKMILRGDTKSGEKLVQQRLAKKFGVGQGVVREALLELRLSGLVDTVDNKGMFVGRLDTEKLMEAFDIRVVCEGLVGRLCCTKITRDQIKELVEIVEKIYAFGLKNQMNEMAHYDKEFHQGLLNIAGNSLLRRVVESYRALGKIVRANRSIEVVYEEHIAILKAIENGQENEAEELMRKHILAAKEAIKEQIRNKVFVPHWVA